MEWFCTSLLRLCRHLDGIHFLSFPCPNSTQSSSTSLISYNEFSAITTTSVFTVMMVICFNPFLTNSIAWRNIHLNKCRPINYISIYFLCFIILTYLYNRIEIQASPEIFLSCLCSARDGGASLFSWLKNSSKSPYLDWQRTYRSTYSSLCFTRFPSVLSLVITMNFVFKSGELFLFHRIVEG